MSTSIVLQEVQPPAVRELARRLLANGASPALARRVVARVESRDERADPVHPLDAAAVEIGAFFPRVELRAERGAITGLALLGVRGCGRTSVARKLALRFRARGLPPGILALEQPASTRPQWLASWCAEMGIDSTVGRATDVLPLDSFGAVRVLVLDGSGALRDDARAVAALQRRVDGRIAWRRIGVLAADGSPARLRAEARALRAVGADCVIVTRIDTAPAPAAALEACVEHRLPVAFLCDGASDENHLRRLEPDLAADVFLRGRPA